MAVCCAVQVMAGGGDRAVQGITSMRPVTPCLRRRLRHQDIPFVGAEDVEKQGPPISAPSDDGKGEQVRRSDIYWIVSFLSRG